jgi:hypothetical protein
VIVVETGCGDVVKLVVTVELLFVCVCVCVPPGTKTSVKLTPPIFTYDTVMTLLQTYDYVHVDELRPDQSTCKEDCATVAARVAAAGIPLSSVFLFFFFLFSHRLLYHVGAAEIYCACVFPCATVTGRVAISLCCIFFLSILSPFFLSFVKAAYFLCQGHQLFIL